MTINTHPALPEFEYIHPETLAEASEFLSRHPDEARPFLGGTDVFVRMRDGIFTPKFLVNVKNLNGTNDLHFDPQSGLTLGAAVNMNRVIASSEVQAHYPLLAEACRSVASYQLRTRATIVGNICNASPAAADGRDLLDEVPRDGQVVPADGEPAAHPPPVQRDGGPVVQRVTDQGFSCRFERWLGKRNWIPHPHQFGYLIR